MIDNPIDDEDDIAFYQAVIDSGISDIEFAKELGISRESVARWKKNKGAPGPSTRGWVFDLIEKKAKNK